jgi:hypothetical protein
MGKKLQKFQNKENGLLPSLTLTRYPLNAYAKGIMEWRNTAVWIHVPGEAVGHSPSGGDGGAADV